MAELTQERLKELLTYDPDSGVFTWKETRNGFVKKGDIAGSNNGKGYIVIMIDKITYQSHRLAWLYMTGEHPKNQIDHINHRKSDNVFSNLREATNQDNQKNTSISKNNTSGIVGVIWHKRFKKWSAQINSGKRYHLGCYKYYIQAMAARFDAEIKHNFHVNHGRLRG